MATSKFEIKGKVALITGGSKGMGFSFAKELLKNSLKGVSLIDVDVINGEKSVQELQQKYGVSSAIFIKADITKEEEFQGAFETTVSTFNHLDIVINNAGISQEIQWRKCIEINLMGTITGSLLAMEKYLPKYKSSHEGVIINIASVLGIQPVEAVPAYVSSKHGIVGFSRSIGGPLHYKTYKVRVLTVCPGLTDTTIIGLKDDQQHEPFKSLMNNFVKSMTGQSTEDVAKNLIEILQDAASGSVWTVVKGTRLPMQYPIVEE